MLLEESNPVSAEDEFNVIDRVSTIGENGVKLLQVGNRIQAVRRLLGSESAIQIAADGGMIHISRELTNMVDVIGEPRNGNFRAGRNRIAGALRWPLWREHPIVTCNSDHTAARDDSLQLLVGKLPIARDQRSAVLMACKNRAAKRVDHFAKSLVAEVSYVEYDSQSLEFRQQFAPARLQRRVGASAARISAVPVMRKARAADATLIPQFGFRRTRYRVASLKRDNNANWKFGSTARAVTLPLGNVLGKFVASVNQPNFASRCKPFVVVQLAQCERVRDFHGAERKSRRTTLAGSTGNERSQAQTNVTSAHLGKYSRRSTSTRHVGTLSLAGIQIGELARQVAVHQQSVPRQIKMAVDDKFHVARLVA